MKKLLLSGTAIMLSLLANAQTVGITTTGAYDDYSSSSTVTKGQTGLFWYKGTGNAQATDVRTAGKETFTYADSTMGAVYLSVDFGTDTVSKSKLTLDLSTMADMAFDIENVSAKKLMVRIVMEDVNGKQTQIEPNVSDVVGVKAFGTPTPGYTNPDGSAVYPLKAYNGFILNANQRQSIRIDLSSVPGAVGGLKAGAYNTTTPTPENSPATSYDFDPSKVHAVLFILNEKVPFVLSGSATDKNSFRYDLNGDPTKSFKQGTYSGSIVFRSFKIGSVLTPLTATGVKELALNSALNVYPNPAKDVLNVSFESNGSATVSLTDIVGHSVYSSVVNAGSNHISVNTSDLASGMYILNVTTASGTASSKVIK